MKKLQNNSNEMKTHVETFIIEETESLIYDNEQLNRWGALVKDLNLQGQTKIAKPEKSPIPFMFVKQTMVNVFETLCPKKVDIKDYDITPIPVEILDLVALSIKEKYFDNIEIWYDDKSPDPLCIGTVCRYYGYKNGVWGTSNRIERDTKQEVEDVIGNYRVYETDEKRYLLGKWGDVKRSFDDLKEMAHKRYIASKKNEYTQVLKQYKRKLDDLETEAFDMFN